ncbi:MULTISPECIES: acetoin utilization AcuB family protein [Sporosarcina]|uniref:Acetoin utilization protein AcuB n=1 Tax=Sporosarcina ureae TaxID=1571 RepID=A0ABM6JTI0_SPOUR|nr:MULTISPECIES: acetoin utilization AcuB family protein [Sporosarcina]ARF13293.1 acetoin utilization protein AcuB [Sporosarcina ureae]PIC58625.1 CBS domain-containing protein [Sporosarcina sp. P10]PIC61944.1 CBS domain-containing protein [Sporosarcina sp. P12(2017)]
MLIQDIMKKDVITLNSTHTIADAVQLMKEKRIRHIPIVKDGRIEGLVTDRDVKEASPSSISERLEPSLYETTLDKIMKTDLLIGHPRDFAEEAALMFYTYEIGCLPIVSNYQLVGILTKTDLLYNYIELTGANQPSSHIQIRVPNTPGILYEASKVFHDHNTNVLSVLVYPYQDNEEYKILAIRIKRMNPLPIIEGLKSQGFEVLWPSEPEMGV